MTHKHGPVYQLKTCIDCAAALIRSARPNRKLQDTRIYFLTRYRGWDREVLINHLRATNV